MEIKLTEAELQFLAENNAGEGIRLAITGSDEFRVIHPKAEVACKLDGFFDRSIVISYDLGFWKNLFVRWFVKFEKEGILWNKKEKQIELDPFKFLPEKEKKATEEFRIQGISLQPGWLVIQLGIIPDLYKKALQISSEGS
ncbi:hypothetical protein D0X99_18430 [Algoriphagus lacus]|uniref:Uncharacterized protein n=1 Tax=Algoriphagus lacus TaxID=2056311 RepID=A0A418PMR0_9BACT|nr:hypothetical protein [Algoriphagus lacus]RIW12770.1 hypothetical protein D0X99_18430 [Algoriphagus lacus]